MILDLQHIDATQRELFGGKGANLGELCRIEGIRVPEGFCISTEAFKSIVAGSPSINRSLDQLALLKATHREKIGRLSDEIRSAIEGAAIPEDLKEEISRHLSRFGAEDAYAVRSSATAEDLPTASFAGQQDTYLNIKGKDAVLKHISRCWASLFTERAITYRMQNGFDHRKVYLAVIVQKMVFPQAAGILFTADPVTSNRKVSSVDAGFGLGEALVSGLVNADVYKVRECEIVDKKIAVKKLAVHALKDGGTAAQEIAPERQNIQVLTDDQILQLERAGRKIEAHFGCPQDVEWCLVEDALYIVQSRPITTLFPVPEIDDQENHVYISVGHQQMMTDPMKPLGLSMWKLTAGRPMYQAGGRLFVDVAAELSTPAGRGMLLNMMGQHDPLIEDALRAIVERGDLISSLPGEKNGQGPAKGNPLPAPAPIENDPALVADLIGRSEASLEALKQNIQHKSGLDLLDFLLEDIRQRSRRSDPRSLGVIIAVVNASKWINENIEHWLGEKNVAHTLSQSVPNNVTSEMGLALLDVADVIRPYPEVIAFLQQVNNDHFLDELDQFEGGPETRDAIDAYLEKYGMRCSGEIDITRPRWSEKPATLVPIMLSHIKNFAPGAGHQKFEQGRQEALRKEQDLLDRLRELPDGRQKAEETQEKISLIRNFAGYREYPKYDIVRRSFVYKQALLKEAERLVQNKVIHELEDIYYLTFAELHEAVRTNEVDVRIIARRKEEYRFFEKLTPPRVITSEGEIVTGAYKREDLPAGAIVGLAVSPGVVEGRARVMLNMAEADLEDGDILVTVFTDPSWTPLFVSVKGLVAEVGGLMTHGAVIAREYGLPAVVGVENATKLIQDGQRIRVHGTEGYVVILG